MNFVVSKPRKMIPINPAPQHYETLSVRPKLLAQHIRFMLGLAPLPHGELVMRKAR